MFGIQEKVNILKTNLFLWYAVKLLSKYTVADITIALKYISIILVISYIYFLCTTAWSMFGKLKAITIIIIGFLPLINIILMFYLVNKTNGNISKAVETDPKEHDQIKMADGTKNEQ